MQVKRIGVGLGSDVDLFALGLARDPDIVMDFPFVRDMLPHVGLAATNIQAKLGTTYDYKNRQVDALLPNQSMHNGVRIEGNILADTQNWSIPHTSSETLDEWTWHAGATIDSSTTFSLSSNTNNHVGSNEYNIPPGKKVAFLVELSHTENVELNLRILDIAPTTGASTKSISVTSTPQWFVIYRKPGSTVTSVRFRIYEKDNVAVSGITFHGFMPFFPSDDAELEFPFADIDKYVSYGVGVGSELVSNGSFINNANSWTAFDSESILSVESGQLKVANNDASAAKAYQLVSTKVNHNYVVSGDFEKDIAGGKLRIGTTPGAGDIYDSGNIASTTSKSGLFVATGTEAYITVETNSATANHYTLWGNLSIKSAEHGSNVLGVKNFTTKPRFDGVEIWGDSMVAQGNNALGNYFESVFGPAFKYGGGGEKSYEVKTRFDEGTEHFNRLVLLWLGRNNYENPPQVIADIEAMIAAIGHNHFIIFTILNGDYNPWDHVGGGGYNNAKIINDYLLTNYPNNCYDARSTVVNAYNPSLTQDVIDFNNDVPPKSLRADDDPLHLNEIGALVVAKGAWNFALEKSLARNITNIDSSTAYFDEPSRYRHNLNNAIGDSVSILDISTIQHSESFDTWTAQEITGGVVTLSGTNNAIATCYAPIGGRAFVEIKGDFIAGEVYVFSIEILSCDIGTASNQARMHVAATSISAGDIDYNVTSTDAGRFGVRFTAGTTEENRNIRIGLGTTGVTSSEITMSFTKPMLQRVTNLSVPFSDWIRIPDAVSSQGGKQFSAGNSGEIATTSALEVFTDQPQNKYDFCLGTGDSFANGASDWPQLMRTTPAYTGTFHGIGRAGQKLTGDIGANFATDLAAHDYGTVFVNGGINDLYSSTTPAELLSAAQSMYAIAKAAGVKFFIFDLPPSGNRTSPAWTSEIQAKVDEYHVLLRGWVHTVDAILIGIYDLLRDPGTVNLLAEFDSGDGLHTTNAAQQLITDLCISSLPKRIMKGVQATPSVTNKNTNYNCKPDVALINLNQGTFDPATTWGRVYDPDFLIDAPHLINKCDGYVIEIDATLATGNSFINIGGTVGNTNPHSCFMYVKVFAGSPIMRVGSTEAKTLSGVTYTYNAAESVIPSSDSVFLNIKVLPGSKLRFAANQIVELPFQVPLIETLGAAETRDNRILIEEWLGGDSNFEITQKYYHQGQDNNLARHLFGIGDDSNNQMRSYIGAIDQKARFDIRNSGTGHTIQTDAAITVLNDYVFRYRFINGVMTMYVNDVLQSDTLSGVPNLSFISTLLKIMSGYDNGSAVLGCTELFTVRKL